MDLVFTLTLAGIILRPLLNEFAKCHTDFGHRGALSRIVAVQKQPSPRATMAARYPAGRLCPDKLFSTVTA
jgi:hypothetical protein